MVQIKLPIRLNNSLTSFDIKNIANLIIVKIKQYSVTKIKIQKKFYMVFKMILKCIIVPTIS